MGGVVYLGALTGVLLGTSLADRFGRHKVMAAAATVFSIGAVMASMAPNPELLGLARFITGIGVGGAITTAMTPARNHAPHARASRPRNSPHCSKTAAQSWNFSFLPHRRSSIRLIHRRLRSRSVRIRRGHHHLCNTDPDRALRRIGRTEITSHGSAFCRP
ncbi:MFS transporter [Arthrobacter sp. cf158]|uniref:MFS transporter n=1 Tax=Arthrobacter sp. cf158 TaxID=1761744 RepID=UPI0015872472